MNVSQFIVNLTSEEPARLAAFYGDVVGLHRKIAWRCAASKSSVIQTKF